METINPYAAPPGGPLFQERRPLVAPVGVAEIVRAATILCFENFRPIAILTLIFWLPLEVLQAYLQQQMLEPDDVRRSLQLSIFAENVIGIIPTAGIMAIGAAAFRGEEATLWIGLIQGLAAWPRMLGTRIVVMVIVLLGMILFIIPGIYILVRTALAEPIAVIEHRGAMNAPGRSFEITQGKFWQVVAVLLVLFGYMIGTAILLELPTLLFDHWLFSAALNVGVDVLAAWPVMLLVAAYWSMAHSQAGGAAPVTNA